MLSKLKQKTIKKKSNNTEKKMTQQKDTMKKKAQPSTSNVEVLIKKEVENVKISNRRFLIIKDRKLKWNQEEVTLEELKEVYRYLIK